jgi:type IV secretory pathway TrbF-like protein
VPALPLPNTSAVTDEEGEQGGPTHLASRADHPHTPDDRLVRIALQRWLTRVCEDPVLQKDDELRSFLESDFGVGHAADTSAHAC